MLRRQDNIVTKSIIRSFIVFMILLMTTMTLTPLQAGDLFAFAKENGQQAQSQDVTDQSKSDLPEGTASDAVDSDAAQAEADENGAIEEDSQTVKATQGETKTETDGMKEYEGEAYAEDFSGLTFEGDQYSVALHYDEAAAIPEGTELTAREIAAKGKAYNYYKAKAFKALQKNAGKNKIGDIAFAKFYDITLTDESGKELEPSAPVDVNIKYEKELSRKLVAENAAGLSVIHFTKDADGAIHAQVLGTDQDKNNNGVAVVDTKTGEGSYLSESKGGDYPVELALSGDQLREVTFTADSFSVYAVVYTVDFHYGDGEYDFSIEGESSILLSDVFARLKIDDVDIADVENVTFSDESLVKVEKKGGDWLLTSLKPFDTEEALTVTLNDGSVITIRVTDAASVGEFIPINNNNEITSVVGSTKFPVYYRFDNGEIVSGDEIGMATELTSGRFNNAAAVVSAGANKTAFQAAWNSALGLNGTTAVTVNRAWFNNDSQVAFAMKAANGNTYYTFSNGSTNSANNTNQVRNEINDNRYMLVDNDKIIVRLSLANNNAAHYAKDGITYGSTQNSVVKAYATELDADTYGSNMLPATVSIAGVPYTVVDNITTFKEDGVTYTLDKANQKATVTSGTPTVNSIDVNGTVYILQKQNQYSGQIVYNGVTYTVDTSRTDGHPEADASAYKAATIGGGTARTISYINDYGQGTEPTPVESIEVSIPLIKTLQSSMSSSDMNSYLEDKSLTFGVVQGNSNPEGGASIALANGDEGTDFTLTYSDLFSNGSNVGEDTNTTYALDGANSPWKATFTKEGTYTFTISETNTGHSGIVNQSDSTVLTYYVVEEEGSLRLAEVYRGENEEIASTSVDEEALEALDLTKLFNTSYALGAANRVPPEITSDGEKIRMDLNQDTSGVITTKFTFDFSRSFEISGHLCTPDSDAVAIAFHGYEALPAYRWNCNNGFDDFHYGNGRQQQELRFLRYGYIPPNGDLEKGFLYNILTRDLDKLRGWYAYKVENNVRLPYVASSGLNGDVRNTDGTYNIVPDAKSYESFNDSDERWANEWSDFKVKFTCRDSSVGLGTLEITAMGKTVQFNDFNASDIIGADKWQDAHFSLGSSVQNHDKGGLEFVEAEYTDSLDSVETSFWADRNHDGAYETKVNTTNSPAVPGESILVRHALNRDNSSSELFFEDVLVRQLKDCTNGRLLTGSDVVTYAAGNMSTAYVPQRASEAFNTDHIPKKMKIAVFQGPTTIFEYKITAPAEYNHTVVESALFGQPPFKCIYTGADGFRTQKELKWDTPDFTNVATVNTITFDPNSGHFTGGSTENKTISALNNTTFTISEEVEKGDGWTFAGWKVDGPDTVYQGGESFNVTGDVTLIAQWVEARSLTISNENTGAYSNADDSFRVEVKLVPGDGQDPLTGNDDPRLALITGGASWSVDNGEATAQFTVDGTTNGEDAIVIGVIPVGWTYTVKEIDSKGYTVKYKLGTDSESSYAEINDGKSGTLLADTTVNIRNSRDTVVPSGLCLSDAGMLMLIAVLASVLAIASKIAFAARRRRQMFG